MKNVSEIYRRDCVSFDAYHFENLKKQGKVFSIKDTFYYIAEINLWGSAESVSGEGSTAIETNQVKDHLNVLLQELKIKTLLDAPCGDFQWLGALDLSVEKYIGVDILEKNIACLRDKYFENKKYQFLNLDICSDLLPESDLILCRDCLVHFSFDDIFRAVENLKLSNAKYLLATTFTTCNENFDIVTGDWRTLNLTKPPFNFPEPLKIITEHCLQNDGLYADKSLGLWKLAEIQR